MKLFAYYYQRMLSKSLCNLYKIYQFFSMKTIIKLINFKNWNNFNFDSTLASF